jgi:hypothetical protein
MNSGFDADIAVAALAPRPPQGAGEGAGAVLPGRGAADSHDYILAMPMQLPKLTTGVDDSATEGDDVLHSPFHPTIALGAKPRDMTTGCAGGYSTTRQGDLIFSNDDYGATSASLETECVTIDTTFARQTAFGSVSRVGKDGTISRVNLKDNRLAAAPAPEPLRVGRKRNQSAEPAAAPGSHLLSVLPPLPVIPVSQGPDGNLAFTAENKPKYNSLKQRLEGPTEYSVWIIPGLLCMGTVPVGRAWRRRQVKTSVHTRTDAAGQLVLGGISTFVSLLSAENEAVAEKRCPSSLELAPERGGLGIALAETEPGRAVESSYKDIVKSSIFELKNVISGYKSQIENWNVEIQINIVDDPLDMRYETSLKEDLRLRARRAIAIECSDAAKKELAALWDAKYVKSEFVRLPIEQDSAPDLTDFLPLLWKLEQRLMAGERLYVYSLEGHGRCGLVCGCLLGRLYGLHPRETLFRMQVYHDFIASQTRRLVPINCPQLINQQELLSSVLKNTNRVFDGVMLRSQLDPETFVSELHHLERGSQVGVYGVSVTESIERRTVPTVYHAPGGRSKKTWADNGEHSFEPEGEAEAAAASAAAAAADKASRRRHTQASGGYSKKGLTLRNTRSADEEAAYLSSAGATSSENGFNSNSATDILVPAPARRGSRADSKRRKSKRRGTTGDVSSGSDNDQFDKERFTHTLSLAQSQAVPAPAPAPALPPHSPAGGGGGGGGAGKARAGKAKAPLRPCPAEGPKLPSIRSRYGDIA